MIGLILTRKRHNRDFTIVQVVRGTERSIDYRPLLAKVNFFVKPQARANFKNLPKQIDANKFKVPLVCNRFVSEINNLLCNGNWN